ncbi:hypothetical protein GE21DRAFT_3031 [Neurospora crassa]|uniref:Myb-like domain-containing protein n=2 Tax=Neurospora crassa TaxID=5141 RepID=Q7SCA9_NEUCR|nr:hypothetical protein NCU05472 [Neurospora crassa OR74A]pir/T51013/ related to calmodulin-binding protein [imported] - Neurospora crassa [Neurospora crassa]EAA34227.1 hypothetical protein NCU05472 [Neurospora crassa OR74A]KHE85231.1 hypothetical protein GE21DRAFT_3031 [Neurospora crassa]CAE55932.1 conserved hypothetical protein [Neurospora crassa]|eukprot:XP_963463.1 hypothetical protein NCU05472 [Neurospora crassa OR74A]
MPPKAAPAEGATSGPVINGQTLTFQETKVVCAILENLTTRVDANWEKVAESLGQKNAKSAREAWRLLRKKCDLNLDGLPEGAAAGAGPASAKKAAPAVAAAENGEVGATPVKRGRGRPPKKALMLTPGNGGDEDAALSTPGTALGNLDLGEMTPETPSKTGSGVKRSAEDATDPDAILFEETPAKKKATPRKPRMTAKQKAALAAAAAAPAPIDESANGTTGAGFVPASSPVGDTINDGDDNSNIDVAMQGVSELEAIADTLAADDAADAAHLVGGIDPDEN